MKFLIAIEGTKTAGLYFGGESVTKDQRDFDFIEHKSNVEEIIEMIKNNRQLREKDWLRI